MNEQKIALLTDTCSDLTPEHIGDAPIFVVPLSITWCGEEYEDGVNITADEVFIKAKKELPKTSLPKPATVYQMLDKIQEAGYTRVIAIMLSSGLSGTHNLVRVAAQDFEDLDVCVIDSRSGAIVNGAIMLLLADFLKKGFSWEKMKKSAQYLVEHNKAFLTLDTLEYLKKGGRIGKVTALAGAMLNLKPIISFEENGELGSIAKCRGAKQATGKMLELLHGVVDGHKRYVLLTEYSGTETGAYEAFRQRALEEFPDHERYIESSIDATLAVYVGPGLLGVCAIILDGIDEL